MSANLSELGAIKNYELATEVELSAMGIKPNDVMRNYVQNIIVIVIYQSQRGIDFSLNCKALHLALEAIKKGKYRKGFVATSYQRPTGKSLPKLDKIEEIDVIDRRIRHVPPQHGNDSFPGSKFWWLDANLDPAETIQERRDRVEI